MDNFLDNLLRGKRAAWQRFCSQIGGEYIKGNFFVSDKVKVNRNGWTIVLDSYSEVWGASINGVTFKTTTAIAPIHNKSGFTFKIWSKTILSSLWKSLNWEKEGIKTGYPELDSNYGVLSSDVSTVLKLVAVERIRQLITSQPELYLDIRAANESHTGLELPDKGSVLYFQAKDIITDNNRLMNLFNLFMEILGMLGQMDLVDPIEDPRVIVPNLAYILTLIKTTIAERKIK